MTRRPVPVVLSSATLLQFTSLWKASATAVAECGVASFFIAGAVAATLGNAAGWFVLAGALAAAVARAMDVESWGLLIPGGFAGAARQAFGRRVSSVASAASAAERLLLGALSAVIIGHYLVRAAGAMLAAAHRTATVSAEDLVIAIAVFVVGLVWVRARIGRRLDETTIARGVWVGVSVVLATVLAGMATVLGQGVSLREAFTSRPPLIRLTGLSSADAVLTFVIGFGLVLPILGGGDVLGRCAHALPPPRIQALRRIGRISGIYALLITTAAAFLFVTLIPEAARAAWADAPLAGLARHLGGPAWLDGLLANLVAIAAALMLIPVVQSAIAEMTAQFTRWSADGVLPAVLSSLHPRFGTPARATDAAVVSIVFAMLLSSGRVMWLGRAYGVAVAVVIVLRAATLVRLRATYRDTRPFTVPLNLRIGRRVLPVGLLAIGAAVAAGALTIVVIGDGPSIAAAALVAGAAFWLVMRERRATASTAADRGARFDLLESVDLSLDYVDARPENVLVPVRNPHALGHVVAALRAAGPRDVVIMTVRLLDADAADTSGADNAPTAYERHLLSEVVTLAERHGHPVRLLIVRARNVVDAMVSTIIRLRSSEVYVGESATLSAEAQARLLGDAWERADKPESLDVRLIVHHRSGRSELFHLGAHAPSLSPADLNLIHRLWLDATKAVGPHVHHHDVVRAALTQMEQQLNSPQRDAALAAIREVARPGEELAAVVRSRDYGRLRDMLRNRHGSDVAALLTGLALEDQAVVFRVLPRPDAAAVFEYLAQDDKERLLKAMAQEDVAALLNNMAPDDRTLFLEELPAEVTRQLLALLSPTERAVAVTLLGYPENSVGRLMTPDYVAIREQWSVSEVLDYVRTHGEDSETLNVVYVVDELGTLIDDIRIREFLLAPLDKRVSDLMDRRFVALKASDSQEDAVALFRKYDRSALPVTDTAGMLIGIVTIDDVLDVAEATATREIQRIGGSEALDEPYISIGFGKMIQKRAGWLTALFIGEMLTATAMGFFQGEISRAVVLALFVPLIISSGGNSGSQAATLVIRALALGEVSVRDWWRVMRRELLAGLALGAILGTIGFIRIALWSVFSDIYGPYWPLVAVTVAFALVGVVLWGTLSGSLLPFVLKRLGFDPAASSAPFVATLVDVTGLVIYFSVALVVLRGTLL